MQFTMLIQVSIRLRAILLIKRYVHDMINNTGFKIIKL
jgi:hypothetical protein